MNPRGSVGDIVSCLPASNSINIIFPQLQQHPEGQEELLQNEMHYEPLPPSALTPFARFNNIDLNGVEATHIGGEPLDAGIGLKYSASSHDPSRPLVTIDRDLILCAKTVEEHAKTDVRLAEALAAVGGFAHTPRGAIMVFLIVYMSAAAGAGVGKSGAWSVYGFFSFFFLASCPGHR